VLICSGDQGAIREQGALLDRPDCAVLAQPFDLDDLLALLQQLIDGPA